MLSVVCEMYMYVMCIQLRTNNQKNPLPLFEVKRMPQTKDAERTKPRKIHLVPLTEQKVIPLTAQKVIPRTEVHPIPRTKLSIKRKSAYEIVSEAYDELEKLLRSRFRRHGARTW